MKKSEIITRYNIPKTTLYKQIKKTQKIANTPNYRLIYKDLIEQKYPHKKAICAVILEKEQLTFLDVIELKELIFETVSKKTLEMNQKYRSYDKATIIEILNYQKKNGLNNTQLANHFKLSRNTVAKWERLFQEVV